MGSHSHTISEKPNSARAARRAGFSGQAMPQLPFTGGPGGKRGPALDAVAVRLTQDQLIRQVIQGGGNMPAYGKNLSPAQTTALVAFLESLHPAGQAPARDASRSLALGDTTAERVHPHPKPHYELAGSNRLAIVVRPTRGRCIALSRGPDLCDRLVSPADRSHPPISSLATRIILCWTFRCWIAWVHRCKRWTMYRSRSIWCSTCSWRPSLLL